MTRNKGKILYVLLSINIVPLFIFGILILLFGSHWFSLAMYQEVETELKNVSQNLITTIDTVYPGDYRLVGDSSYQLYKGDADITCEYSLIDAVKANTGMEVTLFYQDTRILTTITNSEGARIIGSAAPEAVISKVLDSGQAHFFSKALIYNTPYFSYYAPLFNSDGATVGMLFVGKPTAEVDAAIQKSVKPLIVADVVLIFVTSLFIFLYIRRFVSDLLQIRSFLGQVATGNLDTTISPSLLKRNDELGEISHSALDMQHSLHVLIEQDALTSLYNRRSGNKKLQQIMKASANNNTSFCISIGDIDFFKKVNDTYGHDCGDLVLKNVAAMLKQAMRGHGIAARWGGEEFLLIFEDMDEDQSYELLENLLNDIRAMENEYGGKCIKVTMTFGLAAGTTNNLTELLCIADNKLYFGKESGRNRIIR
ncbi:MAG: diguanylate cyclase [Acetatifactor sp.]